MLVKGFSVDSGGPVLVNGPTKSLSLGPLCCRSSAEHLSSASTYDLNFFFNAVYVTRYKLRTLSKGLLEYCTDDTYQEMLKLRALCITPEEY